MLSAKETLNILTKQWCSSNDIMKLAGVGRNKALVIKSKIRDDLISKNYYVPKNFVPSEAVIEKLDIDLDYLIKMVEIENKINEK